MAKKKTSAKPVGPKRGFLSNEEKDSIRGWVNQKLTNEQIARRLNRKVEAVQKFIRDEGLEPPAPLSTSTIPATQSRVGNQLEQRPEWRKWQTQFTAEELEHFKSHYVELMGQFQNDVLPTEELQIFQVITLIIMIDRTLAERKTAMQDMEYWRAKWEDERDSGDPDDPMHTVRMTEYQAQYETARAVTKTCADQYKTYSDKQDKMLQSLKGTRDQRVKVLENSKQSFLGFLRYLQEEDNAIKAGREMELMRCAAEKEKKRLMGDHTYRDGTVDKVLLNDEAMELEDA